MSTNLIYQNADELWAVETRNRERIAGSPVTTYERAMQLSKNHDACLAAVHMSRHETRRMGLGEYDPSD